MAGHSKWSNIKRKKAVVDAKKAVDLNQLSKYITKAVRDGKSSDINNNYLLKNAVAKAKVKGLMKDRIDEAISRGENNKNSSDIQSKTYEIMADEVSVLVDVETDNPNRSIQFIREVAFKYNYKILPQGSLAWQFKEYCRIVVEDQSKLNENGLTEFNSDGVAEIEKDAASIYLDKLANLNIEASAELIKKSEYEIDEDSVKNLDSVIEFIQKLEDNPEVIQVTTNIR